MRSESVGSGCETTSVRRDGERPLSRIDHLTAYHLAVDLVKKAGFRLVHASRSSESCYYNHPALPDRRLRLSTHKSSKSPIGHSGVCARLSFSPKDQTHSELNVYNKVAFAIGRYFLTEPLPSEYKGPKESWNDGAEAAHG